VPAPAPSEITQWLDAARAGDADAYDRVVQALYQDLRRMAGALARGGTLNPTGLVHEVYLKLSANGSIPLNRQHFMLLSARAMRQVLSNHARDHIALKRGGGALHVDADGIESLAGQIESEAEQLIGLDQCMDALGQIDPTMVQLVECRVFAGYTETEAAEATGLSLRSAQRLYADARQHLARIWDCGVGAAS
jgi:RNA polymerase sigma factor (TIGR02999 family)